MSRQGRSGTFLFLSRCPKLRETVLINIHSTLGVVERIRADRSPATGRNGSCRQDRGNNLLIFIVHLMSSITGLMGGVGYAQHSL